MGIVCSHLIPDTGMIKGMIGLHMQDMFPTQPFAISKNYLDLGRGQFPVRSVQPSKGQSIRNIENKKMQLI